MFNEIAAPRAAGWMEHPATTDQIAAVVNAAMIFGSATRTDLLTAAVAARASTAIMETLLMLPEGSYHDVDDVLSALSRAR